MFMNRGIFYSTSKNHTSFYNRSDILYRFRILENEDIPILNLSKLSIGQAENSMKISQELIDLAIKLVMIPYMEIKSLAETKMFRKFVLKTSKLQKVDLERLSEDERRIFFLNVHNTLMIHSYILFSFPKSQSDYNQRISKSYQIGKWAFNLKLLRDACLGKAGNVPADIPRKIADILPDPLIHFCIFTGNSLSPSIRSYNLEDFDENSEQSAKKYILEHVTVDRDKYAIILPRFFETFQKDFGNSKNEFLRNLSEYFNRPERNFVVNHLKEMELQYKDPNFEEIHFIREGHVTPNQE